MGSGDARSELRRRRWASTARSVGLYLVTMAALVTLVFLLPRALPGDPLGALLDPDAGQTFTADARAELEAHYGLDEPLAEQYVQYLGRIVTLDFGWSISQQTPVTELVEARLPWTLLLMGTALALAATISWMVGVRAAWHRGTTRDRAAVAVLTTLRAIPEFVIATALLIVFAVVLPWFPVAGNRTVFAQHSSWVGGVLDVLHHLVLPVTALTLSLIGTKFLLVRNTMIGCLGQDYMVMARAKGLPEAIQRRRHAGRNAIAPFLTLLGIQVGFAVGGTIFVEQVFSYPGMGTLVLSAVDFRDYPLLEALFLILAATVLAANLVVDLVTTWITPSAVSSRP